LSRRDSHERIDLGEFARTRGTLSGSCEPGRLERLQELLAGDDGRIEWSLSGERRTRPEGGSDGYLTLRLTGRVQVECIRCLKPVDATLDEERVFRLTATESQAQRIDAESDDFDALVEEVDFDVLELVEDEAILALPIAPRHADCALPAEIDAPTEEPESRPNPFAVLQALKGKDGERQ
jgi:uncharacterized protein